MRAATRVLAVTAIGLAGLSGFAATGWSQTFVKNVCDLDKINTNAVSLSANYILGRDVHVDDFTCNGGVSFDFTPIGQKWKAFYCNL